MQNSSAEKKNINHKLVIAYLSGITHKGQWLVKCITCFQIPLKQDGMTNIILLWCKISTSTGSVTPKLLYQSIPAISVCTSCMAINQPYWYVHVHTNAYQQILYGP